MLRSECLYATVFEKNYAEYSTHSELPHPFVIEPPETGKMKFSPEDSFSFHLLLFGNTTQKLPYFIHAVNLLGERGFGKRAGGIFEINSIQYDDTVIYSKTDQLLHQPPAMDLKYYMDSKSIDSTVQLQVQLLTPLRLKYENRIASHLPFHLLIRACLRRISTLFSTFGSGEPDLNYTEIISNAQKISTIKSNLRRLDWKGYSFRQKQEIHLGGLVGDVIYEGNLSQFLPLLKFGKRTHIGKQTTFGLGRFDMNIAETSFSQ